jgi:hypothetical protein
LGSLTRDQYLPRQTCLIEEASPGKKSKPAVHSNHWAIPSATDVLNIPRKKKDVLNMERDSFMVKQTVVIVGARKFGPADPIGFLQKKKIIQKKWSYEY